MSRAAVAEEHALYTPAMAKKSAKRATKAKPETPPFEEALAKLHAIVAELESGEISLEDSLARYEEGVALLRGCHQTLADAELRIRQLSGFDDEGEPETAPFDATASADAVSGAGRRNTSADGSLFG